MSPLLSLFFCSIRDFFFCFGLVLFFSVASAPPKELCVCRLGPTSVSPPAPPWPTSHFLFFSLFLSLFSLFFSLFFFPLPLWIAVGLIFSPVIFPRPLFPPPRRFFLFWFCFFYSFKSSQSFPPPAPSQERLPAATERKIGKQRKTGKQRKIGKPKTAPEPPPERSPSSPGAAALSPQEERTAPARARRWVAGGAEGSGTSRADVTAAATTPGGGQGGPRECRRSRRARL